MSPPVEGGEIEEGEKINDLLVQILVKSGASTETMGEVVSKVILEYGNMLSKMTG